MKQLLLNTMLGHITLDLRDKFKLVSTGLFKPEMVGTLVNDQLASLLITRLCQPNKVFIDVGAHIGSVISEVHLYDKSIEIIAIEAIPEKVNKLKKKFSYAEIHECAVGESEDTVSFFINTAQSGYSSLSSAAMEQSTVKEITVPLKKLDNIITTTNTVDAIKIDVEGAELGVLRGGHKLLTTHRPTIMFESAPINNDDNLGYTKEALWQYLTEHDYSVLIPNRVAHNDKGLSLDGFLDSHIYPRRTTNYFAVHKTRRVEIRDYARQILKIKR